MDYIDVIVGLISNFIVFAPTILMANLFKKSKVFTKRENRVDRGIDMAIEQRRFKPPPQGGCVRDENDLDRE